jgi:hypothetical protein
MRALDPEVGDVIWAALRVMAWGGTRPVNRP